MGNVLVLPGDTFSLMKPPESGLEIRGCDTLGQSNLDQKTTGQKTMRKILVLAALLTCFAGVSLAGTFWEFDSPANSNTNNTWAFGNTFTVNNTITVTALGYYDENGDGFIDPHEVGIYSAGGALLASTIVTSADPLVGHWRYAAIAGLTLTAGLSYEIVGVSHGDNYTWNDPGFVVDPNITYTGNGWDVSSVLVMPTQQNDVTDGYWGANAEFGSTTTPEPGTIGMMLGAGLLGLLTLRRRAR